MADHAAESSGGFAFSNRAYDVLKAFAQYVLPAVATLYATVAGIWGLGFSVEVVATITAVDTFLGVILGLLKRAYNKSDAPYDGQLVVDSSDPTKDVYSLEVHTPLEQAKNNGSITLKVAPPA